MNKLLLVPSAAILVIYVAFQVTWYLVRQHLLRKNTALSIIPLLELPPPKEENKIKGTAVIAGGSLSGYATARVLGDYFEKVTIIEADPNLALQGTRVGQRAQLHVIQTVGLRVARALFPGYDEEVRKIGGIVRSGWTRRVFGHARIQAVPENVPPLMTLHRLTLEKLIRKLTTAYLGSKLTFIQGTVTGVKASSDGSAIEAVTYRPVNEAATQTLPTVFFADCSGQTSMSSKYLPATQGANWGPYKKSHYHAAVAYSTSVFTVPEKARDLISRTVPKGDMDYGRWDLMTVITLFTPTSETGRDWFAIQKVDNDQMVLSHSAWGVDDMCRSFSHFREIVDQVMNDSFGVDSDVKKQWNWVFDLLDVIEESTDDVDELVKFIPYRVGQCQWIDFEGGNIPGNFVAVGDSRMFLEPTYGQGVTKLLCDTAFLNETLRNVFTSSKTSTPTLPSDFSRRYFKRQLPFGKGLYEVNKMLDYGYSSTDPDHTSGETLKHGSWFRTYWNGLLEIVAKDPVVSRYVLYAVGGLSPWIDFVHPSIAIRVLWKQLRA